MTSPSVSFQTRARTIDHLGREQIADVPTAVSELWKNAYDAYARSVALHIYAGAPPMSAIFDDGHGMTYDQFITNWLVVGTESKVSSGTVSRELRDGLPERPRQGQKGIGRLSVAALGPTALIVSKQIDHPYVACLVDWRLFENPFLYLQDIRLPVVEFGNTGDLAGLLPGMRTALLENLSGQDGDQGRRARLLHAWKEFDDIEVSEAPPDAVAITTSTRIRDAQEDWARYAAILDDWQVWRGERDHGTALVVVDCNPFLAAWVAPPGAKNDEAEAVKASMRRTLNGFSDPYEDEENTIDYRVVVHDGRRSPTTEIARDEDYGGDFLHGLEHYIDGTVDEYGVFRGAIKAYGRDLGAVELLPPTPPPNTARDRVGPFKLCIGTFEQIPQWSTHAPSSHAALMERADSHSGLNVYRDGLRVMPYGRPENDFFKIEERRQSHAGREFWASRRLFGRIAIRRAANPNLRDKAGREGLIDNRASREFQTLVVDILRRTARLYFGSDSKYRKEWLPEIQAENERAAEKSKGAKRFQKSRFQTEVKAKSAMLEEALALASALRDRLTRALAEQNGDAIFLMSDDLGELVGARSELRLPPRPKNLGSFEDKYRSYRDRYSALAASVESIQEDWIQASERFRSRSPSEIVRSHLGRNQQMLTNRLLRWKKDIVSSLKGEIGRIEGQVEEDLKSYYKGVAGLLSDVENARAVLSAALEQMDETRDHLLERFVSFYEPYERAIRQLAQGIDLDAAFAYAGAREDVLERKLQQIQSLAQTGISVEILAHELHDLDREMAINLAALPPEVHRLDSFRRAEVARKALVAQLGFLAKLALSRRDTRERLTGASIYDYVVQFFRIPFGEKSISVEMTDQFQSASFYEFPSRIYPVFVNLINNALYWTAGRDTRKILFSADDGTLMVSDNGPGVDPDDVGNLFELFFTRRIRGRGVGLYLCKETLAAGGHNIEYVTQGERKALPGANFLIRLRNGFDG